MYQVTPESIGDWHRNIVSLRKSVSLFDDLVDDPAEAEVLIRHEIATKPTHHSVPIIHRPFEEVEVYDPIRAAISWPFEHPLASRYSDGTFGVWYGARAFATSVYETVYHFRRDTLASAVAVQATQPIIQHRRVHRVHCNSMLVDLRAIRARDRRVLDPTNYAPAQALGATLRAASLPGLLAPSVRDSQGIIVAVFTATALSDPRDVCFLTYRLDAKLKTVEVQRARGTVEFRIEE